MVPKEGFGILFPRKLMRREEMCAIGCFFRLLRRFYYFSLVPLSLPDAVWK